MISSNILVEYCTKATKCHPHLVGSGRLGWEDNTDNTQPNYRKYKDCFHGLYPWHDQKHTTNYMGWKQQNFHPILRNPYTTLCRCSTIQLWSLGSISDSSFSITCITKIWMIIEETWDGFKWRKLNQFILLQILVTNAILYVINNYKGKTIY